MKNIRIIATVLFASIISLSAQSQDYPDKGFTLNPTDKSIQLAPGETKKVDVHLLRSKSYNKTKIELDMDSSLPEGLTVRFEDGTDPQNSRVMVITAAPTAEAFQKTVILKGKSSRFSKGVMMSLSVSEQALSAN